MRPATLAQWNAYLDSAGVGENAIASRSNFLDLEKRRDAYARLRSGEVLVWRNNGGQTENVPHGLIHDWSGAVFIPNVAIPDVLSVTRDYNHYADIYAPAVVDAENLGTSESHGIFSMLIVSKVLFVTAALRGQYKSQYVQVDANRWYSISQSTSCAPLRNTATPTCVFCLLIRGRGTFGGPTLSLDMSRPPMGCTSSFGLSR